MKKIILILTCFIHQLFAETSMGMTIILDTSDLLVSLDDPMLGKLKSALDYKFPIIVSYKLFSALEVQMDHAFEEIYPNFIVQHQGNLVLLVHKITEKLLEKALNFKSNNLNNKNFMQDIKAIFTLEKTVEWSLYLTGHGTKNTSIAGISIKEFKDFLNFLNTDITTRFFIYSTCYGGGCNKNSIIPELNGYRFPVVVIGSAETVTVSKKVNLEAFFNGLSKLSTYKQEDYYKLLRTTGFITTDLIVKGELDIYNIPQILEPWTQAFKPLKAPTYETVLISDATLINNTLFTVPGITQAIIIDKKTNEIIVEINRATQLPKCIVAEPGDYYLNTLKLPQASEKDFLAMFFLQKQNSSYSISFGHVELKDKLLQDVQVQVNGETVTLIKKSILNELFKDLRKYFLQLYISIKIL